MNTYRVLERPLYTKNDYIDPERYTTNTTALIPVANNSCFGDVLHVNLYTLHEILHLLVGFWYVLGIRQFGYHCTTFPQESVESWDKSAIAPLGQLYPRHHDARIVVSPPHIQDQLDRICWVLFGMTVRTKRAVLQGLERAVISILPTVDILLVHTVADRLWCDTSLVGMLNYCLPKSHCLCFSIHGKQDYFCHSVLSEQLTHNTAPLYSPPFFSLNRKKHRTPKPYCWNV